MKHNIIIIAGQKFSKSELTDAIFSLAETAPAEVRETALLISETADKLRITTTRKVVAPLADSARIRHFKNKYDRDRGYARYDRKGDSTFFQSFEDPNSPEAFDAMSKALVLALADAFGIKEVK